MASVGLRGSVLHGLERIGPDGSWPAKHGPLMAHPGIVRYGLRRVSPNTMLPLISIILLNN
eukprot:scaffold101422_cov32-Tisochrysis_lutea.AAC.4